MPSTPSLQHAAVAAVGGACAASAGSVLAASPALWSTGSPDLLTLIQLAVVGILIGIGQGLSQIHPITWKATIGRGLMSMGISLIAGLTLYLDPTASPIVVIGAGALLSTIGAGGIQEILRAKFNVQPHQKMDRTIPALNPGQEN